MQIHTLKPVHKDKGRKRVGRGGKKGTYSGKGIKGQKSRAGRKMQPMIREIIKRYPKLRGYRQNVLYRKTYRKTAVVNLLVLEKKFQTGERVNPLTLLEKRIISKIKGRLPEIKILAKGKLSKKLVIEGCQISKAAKEKIEKANGKFLIPNS